MGSALGLFAVVALQGTYSMILVVRCKNAVQRHGIKAQSYEDLGGVAFGATGRRLIGGLVVTLQLGVCCIFISLLVTNMRAALPGISGHTIFFAVFCVCALLSLLRDLSDLWPLSTAANAIMLSAIATAVIVSVRVLSAEDDDGEQAPSQSEVTFSTVARCLSVEFFAYEGIALVLPVENSYHAQQPRADGSRTSPGIEMLATRSEASGGNTEDAAPEGAEPAASAECSSADNRTSARGGAHDADEAHRRTFERVLLCAMWSVAFLFVVLGSSVATAFPLIDSGSVTAFLAERSQGKPGGWWHATVNYGVSLAIMLTFPLQLQPAVMVLDRAIFSGDGTAVAGAKPAERSTAVFVLTRVLITSVCAFVVFLVPSLDLLIALLGALCQTSLAFLPFALSIKLHRLGLVTFSPARLLLHVLLMAFCGWAMVVGSYCAIADIALSHVSSKG